MPSVILFLVLVVAMFIVLCYTFNKSKIELESPTIAAMEAHAEVIGAGLETDERDREEEQGFEADEEPYVEREREEPAVELEEEPVAEVEHDAALELEEEEGAIEEEEEPAPDYIEEDIVDEEEPSAPPPLQVTDYEYRVMLEEGAENYVLPQWMLNFFSSSDICHTLDPSDNMVIIAKLNNAGTAESGIIDMSADCDMGAQTISLVLCFGEGAEAETFKTKFYLFERGDLFELGRLVRQDDIRIDVLARGSDYTLEYVLTSYCKIPRALSEKIKDILSKTPM